MQVSFKGVFLITLQCKLSPKNLNNLYMYATIFYIMDIILLQLKKMSPSVQ